MNELEYILNPERVVDAIIGDLKKKSVEVPDWEVLKKKYYPSLHDIVKDQIGRKDKKRGDGQIDKAARIAIGMERLHVNRLAGFIFAIPVRRIYHNIEDSPVRQDIAKAIENIYKYAKVKKENLKRGKKFYASCEIFTIWYAVKRPNTLYGFNCNYKLKCKTYSPMDGTKLYPLFDEYDDMIAMSFEYKKTINGTEHTYFETYTADKRYKWENDGYGWKAVVEAEALELLKIPGVYKSMEYAVYEDLTTTREDIEYNLSRDSDVVAYNSAPLLAISGEIVGEEDKGETRRLLRLKNGADAKYISWNQSTEASKNHFNTMTQLYWTQAQLPDISFANMVGLGNIGYDARQTLFAEAELKVGEEEGDWIEFFEREASVIKAFLKLMKADWASEVDNVEIEHIITPFTQNDDSATIDKAMKGNGGKPVFSHLQSVQMVNSSSDPQAILQQIQEEEAQQTQRNITNIFNEEGM